MEIINSTISDLEEIFRIYDAGTAYQKTVARKYWKGFDRDMVIREIKEGKQWKVIRDGKICGVCCTAFSDPFIWADGDTAPAVYLHRIAVHPDFRGNGLVKQIVDWASGYAAAHEKRFIRLDTGSGNERLNRYYISCGFRYLGTAAIRNADDLPAHYKEGDSSLFEIDLQVSAAAGDGAAD